MGVENVTVLAGYRLIFSENTWTLFCKELYDYMNPVKDCVCKEHDKCCGTSNNCPCYDKEQSDFERDIYDHLPEFFEQLQSQYPDITYKTIICCPCNNDMDLMIDIGYLIGKFNINGSDDDSSADFENAMNSMHKAKNLDLAHMFFWKYCKNQEVAIFGQADSCLYCS